MGRMAEARKKARHGATAGEAPSVSAETTAARDEAEPRDDGATNGTRARREPAASNVEPGPLRADANDFVFPAEPSEASAATADRGLTLPSSGLAEEILPRVRVGIPRPLGTSGPARIELPASGLAEEVLAQHEGVGLSDRSVAATRAASTDVEAAPAAPAGMHSLSFFAAPMHEQRAVAEPMEHIVTFFLDREEYGVNVKQVQEIRRVGEVTPVPRAPEFVRGVINLRGRILPVVDLRAKLGMGEVAASPAARILVVRIKDRALGLLADRASQVLKVLVSRIEPPPEEVVDRGGDYIRGLAKLDDRLIILVDLEKLLAHELRGGAARGAEHPGMASEA